MAKLFGFSIDDKQNKSPSVVSPVPETNQDGVDNYVSSGFYGSYVDIEGQYRTEFDLIRRYRDGERRTHVTHRDGHAYATIVISLSDYEKEYRGGIYRFLRYSICSSLS